VRGMHCIDRQTYEKRSACIDWPEVKHGSKGILLNPAEQIDQKRPTAEMRGAIRNLFGIDSDS